MMLNITAGLNIFQGWLVLSIQDMVMNSPTVTFVSMDSTVKLSLINVQDWRTQKDVGMNTKRSASDMVVRKHPFLTTLVSVSHPLKNR